MKKILQMILALGLTVTPASASSFKKTSVSSSKYYDYIESWNEYLYYKFDSSSTEESFVKKNFKSIITENFEEESWFKSFNKDINIKFLSYKKDKLKVSFFNKKNSNILENEIAKEFTLVLYNYDQMNKFIKNTQDYLKMNPIYIDKNNYVQMEIEHNIENKFKGFIDWYGNELLYLNDINEFFEFLDFDAINQTLELDNNLKADFLCNSNIKFYFKRRSMQIRKNIDNKINFSKDLEVIKFNISNWLSKKVYLNSYDKKSYDFFNIESFDYNKGIVTFSLNEKYFDIPLIMSLEKK
ncbi:hypothetical protein SLITO_v1c02070 [Spiroplasma litorale]|uniref:Uncharacterized protein n=1 Tax=Spiroplasma litorale TaxID=216942 RepID=A0A0K1W124_9MOLU|nr:hypothetical protein [Spiroplasma litorale]AKX33868.1 hypothetical protein SLITO_v1c02070 [Spiroplasma litorale]